MPSPPTLHRAADPTTAHYSATSAFAVRRDGADLGFVYRRDTTKTGFRRGYCVGQVRDTRWFWCAADERENDGTGPRGFTLRRGWATRADALAAMMEHLDRPATPTDG